MVINKKMEIKSWQMKKRLKNNLMTLKHLVKKKITVVTNSIIFLLLSLGAFGYYAYNSNLFKDGHSKQISTEIENNIVKETLAEGEKNVLTESIVEETLAEGETLESKNN